MVMVVVIMMMMCSYVLQRNRRVYNCTFALFYDSIFVRKKHSLSLDERSRRVRERERKKRREMAGIGGEERRRFIGGEKKTIVD